MTEAERTKQNTERLLLLDDTIRIPVANVLQELEIRGFKPKIDKDVHRTPARQLELFKQGRTKVRWGFHNATTKDGKPGSLAADIVDASLAWNAPRSFWLALGAAAKKYGLNWGGYFGLSIAQKAAVDKALDVVGGINGKLQLGWDVAHVETTRVSIAEAKAGRR